MADLFTFIFEYDGGTYMSQYTGRTSREAFRRWLAREPAKLEAIAKLRLKDRLLSQYNSFDKELVPIDRLVNAWCWTAVLPKGLALLNFVKTIS
jgi:hypothetical protein